MSARIYPFPVHLEADLYDYAPRPEGRGARRSSGKRKSRRQWNPRITDDWPERIPVSEVELDVFEAHFGDLLDELFASKD